MRNENILPRFGNAPVNRALHVIGGQQVERIARVDGHSPVLRLHPLPFAGVVATNLQRSNRLTEKQSERTEVGVPATPKAEFGVLLGRKLAILHVTEVVLRQKCQGHESVRKII